MVQVLGILDSAQNYKGEIMLNYQTITTENMDGTTTDHIIIDRGNEEFTSFPAVDGNPAYEQFKLDLAKTEEE
jgi:hypothetical protein